MVVLIDPTVKHNLVEKSRVQKIFTDFENFEKIFDRLIKKIIHK